MDRELRRSGLDVLGSVPWGTHFCQFYQSQQDLVEVLVPYFHQGLRDNELCMWVTSEPLGVEEATAALREVEPDLDQYLRRGQIEILDYTEWYLRDGHFDSDRVLEGWVDKLEAGSARGYDGLRLTGNTFWLESRDWAGFTAYEAAVDTVIGNYRMIAMCTYSLDRCGATEIMDVLSNHEFALIKREGRWETVESRAQRAGRKRAEDALQRAYEALEERVRERTAELAESEARFRVALECSNIIVSQVDTDLRYTWIYAPKPDFELAGVIGHRDDELLPPGIAAPIMAAKRRALETNTTVRRELSIARESGHRWYMHTAAPLRDASGGVVGLTTAAVDITERKQLEQNLLHSQKMEAIGRLAGGVAHDFNNMLQVILSYGSRLLARMGTSDPRREFVAEIVNAGNQAATLTRNLLAFGRRQVLAPSLLDLNEVVRGAESMLRGALGEDIDLQLSLAPEVGRVEVDPGQIQQVVFNLAVNARHAMPRGGKLTIETSAVELAEGFDDSEEPITVGRYVVLAISDTGCGMDEETCRRAFDPYFTTKPPGEGTGLGLSIVHGVVRQSGGTVRIYSEPDRGTTVKVYLPCVDRPETSRVAPRPAGDRRPIPSGAGTVLLVEDNAAVRKDVARQLIDAGYEVLEASDSTQAHALSRGHPGPICLLLTDVVLPGESGKEVYRVLSQERPGLRVLYMSGHAENHIVHRGVLDPGTPFIMKPFEAEQLASKLGELLSQALPRAAPR